MRRKGSLVAVKPGRYLHLTLLALVTAIACILRIWMIFTQRVNMDEGVYLNDARYVLQGMLPFRDFLSREPLFIYALAADIKIFGLGLIQGRLLMLFGAIVAVLVAYGLGRYFLGRFVGLLSAGFFAISPFAIYQGTIIRLELIESAMVGLSLLLLAVAVHRGSAKTFCVAGAVLGLAILFRRSALVFVPIEGLLLLLLVNAGLARKVLSWVLGLTLSFIPILYLMSITDSRWIWNTLGWGELIPIPWGHSTKAQVLFSVFTVILASLSAVPLFFEVATGKLANKMWVRPLIILAWLAVASIVWFGSSGELIGAGVTPISHGTRQFFLFLFLSTLAIVLWVGHSHLWLIEQRQHSFIFLAAYFLGYVLFFVRYPALYVDYFMEVAIPLSIMLAAVVQALYGGWARHDRPEVSHERTKAGLIAWWSRRMLQPFPVYLVSIAVAMLFTAVFVYGAANPFTYVSAENPTRNNYLERSWSQQQVRTIVSYVTANTEMGETVYTADMIFTSLADRDPPHGVSYPHHYLWTSGDRFLSYDPYDLEPAVSEIMRRMEEKNVKLVVVGWLTRNMFEVHPEFARYVQTTFAVSIEFGNPGLPDYVYVMKRKERVS